MLPYDVIISDLCISSQPAARMSARTVSTADVQTPAVFCPEDGVGGRGEIYFNKNPLAYLRTTCPCMPITPIGIAHCCRVTSLYFWTLQNISPTAMQIPTMSKATSYFLHWFYTFYSRNLKTSHTALLWDQIFIIFSPSLREEINRNKSTRR